MRALVREKYRPYHDQEILQADPESTARVLASIDEQGPLSSLEFEDRERFGEPGSWSGSTRTKRILRPTAESAVWSACSESQKRKLALTQLVEEGSLTKVHIGELPGPFYTPSSALQLLDEPLPTPRVIFMGPLDSLLWDRKSIQQIFDFDYVWEVYKPAEQRKWGYYVLPVFFGDRFIARIDSRLEKDTWIISRWWWESEITPDADLLDAITRAIENFLHYLRADRVCYGDTVDLLVKQVTFDRV